VVINKKTVRNLVIVFGIIIFGLTISLLYTFVWRTPTSQEIYAIAQNYVVEVKAQTGDTLISCGSAVLINTDGFFVTNAHVISYTQGGILKEFENYYVRFSFETDYRSVELIEYDVVQDLAILKIQEKPSFSLKPVKIANSTNIKVGDEVYAVGNGMNHGVGLTHGYVSLPRVNIVYNENTRSVIQCDLIINEGNSGGALLNDRGDLLGLTTFRIKDSKGVVIYGMAFCLPSELVSDFLDLHSVNY